MQADRRALTGTLSLRYFMDAAPCQPLDIDRHHANAHVLLVGVRCRTALCEARECDVRSCLNHLQFVNEKTGR